MNVNAVCLFITLLITVSVAEIKPFDGSTLNRKLIESDTFANSDELHIIVEPLNTVGAYDLFFHPQIDELSVSIITF